MSKNSYTRENKGNSLLEFPKTYVVLDIETTGFSPKANKIIEIAAIKVINGIVKSEYQALINIKENLPEMITRLTGITDEMVKDGKNEEIVINEIDNFIGNNIIVGHNVNFDINFLYDYYEKYLYKSLTNDFIDTQRLAKKLVKDTYNYKLITLAKKFAIVNDNAHRALNDVYVTKSLFEKLEYINNHFLDIRMKQIMPNLHMNTKFSNKKIAIKTKLKHFEDSVITEILKRLGSKVYFFLASYADILVVNDHTYQKLQEPLNPDDEYMMFFNSWMYKAQERVNEKTLEIISETELCQCLGLQYKHSTDREVDETNPLYNKNIVFTGTLERMNRKQAETIVLNIGGTIGKSVTKKTNYLVLGNNDYNRAIKDGKSSKYKKAEELKAKGLDIEIIPEDMFYEFIGEE